MSRDREHLEMTVHMNGAIIAAAVSILVARGAFEAAVRLYPAAAIQLRHRARLIDKWPRDAPAAG